MQISLVKGKKECRKKANLSQLEFSMCDRTQSRSAKTAKLPIAVSSYELAQLRAEELPTHFVHTQVNHNIYFCCFSLFDGLFSALL